jgi:hypothetical protein
MRAAVDRHHEQHYPTGASMKTNLETVAAQRDELSTKLREMAIRHEAALTEIGRLTAELALVRAAQQGLTTPGFGEPIQTQAYISPLREDMLTTGVAAADIERGALVSEGPTPGTFVPALPIEPPAEPPKPKRSRLFGGKS